MPKHEGPGKCRYHKKELIWILKEWVCGDCEDDPERTNPNIRIGTDGPDGFEILDIDPSWYKKGGI